MARVLLTLRSACTIGIGCGYVCTPTKNTLAWLDLAEVLLTKVGKAKLKVSHTTVFVPVLSQAVIEEDRPSVVKLRAWQLLRMLGGRQPAEQPTIALAEVDRALDQVESQDKSLSDAYQHHHHHHPDDRTEPQEEQDEVWTFLAAITGLAYLWTSERQGRLLRAIYAAAPDLGALRTLRATTTHQWPFSQAAFARWALGAIEACLGLDPIPPAGNGSVEGALQGAVEGALEAGGASGSGGARGVSEAVQVHALAAQCTATLLLAYNQDTAQVVHSFRTCCSAATASLPVRTSTFHTIGTEVQAVRGLSTATTTATQRVLQVVWDILWSNADQVPSMVQSCPRSSSNQIEGDNGLEVAAQLTWALANILDVYQPVVKPSTVVSRSPLLPLTQIASWIAFPERVSINAVRALGSLLACLPISKNPSQSEQAQEGVHVAFTALSRAIRSRTPKMRWNAAAAIQRALSNSAFPPGTSSLSVALEDLEELRTALLSNLRGTTTKLHWKVVRACASTLMTFPSQFWIEKTDEQEENKPGQVVRTCIDRLRHEAGTTDLVQSTMDILIQLEQTIRVASCSTQTDRGSVNERIPPRSLVP